jgi:hypothetical protein
MLGLGLGLTQRAFGGGGAPAVIPEISYVGTGAYAAETSATPSFAFPTGLQAGDVLVLGFSFKTTAVDVSSVSGWTYQIDRIGGIGADSTDSGSFRTYVYTKIADGTESGAQTVNLTGTGAPWQGRMIALRKTGGTWAVVTTYATEATPSTSWNENFASAQDLLTGDYLVTWLSANGNLCTPNAAMQLNGSTPMTLVGNDQTSSSSDMSAGLNYLAVAGAGTATSITQAFSGTANAVTPTGTVILLRLRAT